LPNAKNFVGSGSDIANSDIDGRSGGTNIDSNPGFVSTKDFQLQASSTATGMGLY
jgi:hypothetical protein